MRGPVRDNEADWLTGKGRFSGGNSDAEPERTGHTATCKAGLRRGGSDCSPALLLPRESSPLRSYLLLISEIDDNDKHGFGWRG